MELKKLLALQMRPVSNGIRSVAGARDTTDGKSVEMKVNLGMNWNGSK